MKEIKVAGKLSEESVKTFGLPEKLSRPTLDSVIRSLQETHQSEHEQTQRG